MFKLSFKIFLSVCAVILVMSFLNYKNWLDWPKEAVYWASYPFLKTSRVTGNKISSGFNFFLTIKDIAFENRALKEENNELKQKNSEFKEAAVENKLLRDRLGLGEADQSKTVLADIIGYDPQIGQYFLVNKGIKDGVKIGQAAVTGNNFLVGKVAEVESHWSKVVLILDGVSIMNAQTQDTRVDGAIKGFHGTGIIMEMIPVDQKINQGETVLTSGLNGDIPKGLIIGKVNKIILKESEIFQKASIEPAVDFSRLEQFFILIK